MKRSSTTIGLVAIILALVSIVGLVFITLFYSLNPDNPFGTLNDYCVALGGILSGVLATLLFPFHRSYAPRANWLALVSVWIGAIVAPLGSWLVITSRTGWFLAGLVTTFGYAFIGLWLLALNYSARRWIVFPQRLATFGMIVGGLMAVGLLAGPEIIVRIDSMDLAHWNGSLALFLGGMSWNILYTIWCIWLGRLLLSNKLILQNAKV